jgi:hypothetical protein
LSNGFGLLGIEPAQGQRGDQRLAHPLRLELGAVGGHQQQRKMIQLPEQRLERFQRGGIGPVAIHFASWPTS